MFGVVLKRQHKGINTADEILNVGLIPGGVAAGDALAHLLPGKMQLMVALFNIVRHIPAVQRLQRRGAQRLLPGFTVFHQ